MTAYWLLDFSKAIFGFLPRFCALWLGSRLGILMYFVAGKRRRTAKANLTYTLGVDKSYREICRLARLSFCHVGMRLVEFARIGKYTERQRSKRVSPFGEANLEEAFSRRNGVIYLTSQLGCPDLVGTMVRGLGYPCVEVVSPEAKKRLERLSRPTRVEKRFLTVEGEGDKSRLMVCLRNNKGVAVAIDETAGSGEACVRFFGRPAAMSALPAELAMLTEAAVLPTFLLMDMRNNYSLIFEKPLKPIRTASPDESVVANAASFCKAVERYVGKHPAQWPWMRKVGKPPRDERIRKPFREAERILIKMPNWLGDAVMSLPAIDYLRRLFPHAWIACLIKEGMADVVRNNDVLDAVIAYEHGVGMRAMRRKIKTVRRLRRKFFDLAVLLTNSFESALWMYRARVPLRVGYKAAGRGFLLTHPVLRNPSPAQQIQYYLDLCKALGDAGDSCSPRVRISDRDRKWAEDFLKSIEVSADDVLIGLCPGAAYGPAKRWLAGRFVELGKRISEEYPAKVVVFGGESDIVPCANVADGIGQKAINLCGKTTLRELSALLGRCDLLVSNDSGAMHLAAAIGRPVIGIFGPTDPARTAPPENCTVVKKDIACSPCSKRECPTDFRCMTSVSVEEVFEKAAGALFARSSGKSERRRS